MEHVYQTLFLVGLVYTAITTLLGGLFDIFNIGGDIDLDGDIPWFNIFKPITVMSFITVFGGVGLIGVFKEINPVWNFLIAMGSGLIVVVLLHKFVVIPLRKAENTSAPINEDLIGLQATVITPIYENGFGSIGYSFKGNRYNSPARHLSGKTVPKGEEVLICEIRDKVFYVVPVDESPKLSDF